MKKTKIDHYTDKEALDFHKNKKQTNTLPENVKQTNTLPENDLTLFILPITLTEFPAKPLILKVTNLPDPIIIIRVLPFINILSYFLYAIYRRNKITSMRY